MNITKLIAKVMENKIVDAEVSEQLIDFDKKCNWLVNNSIKESRYISDTISGKQNFLGQIEGFYNMSFELQSKLKKALIETGKTLTSADSPILKNTSLIEMLYSNEILH